VAAVPFVIKKSGYGVSLDSDVVVKISRPLSPHAVILEVSVKTTATTDVLIESSEDDEHYFLADKGEGVTEFHAGYFCTRPYVRITIKAVSGATCDYLITGAALS